MANCELKTLSDQALLELVQLKDHKAAFSELYNRYWEPLINHAGKRTGSLAMAEEIVQAIFVDFYLRRKEITLSHSLSAYLKTAIKFQVFINPQFSHCLKKVMSSRTPDQSPCEVG